MSRTRKPWFRRLAFKIHKWAGLAGGLWLFVLGATGIVLDHDEWRWARQGTVPKGWLSPNVGRLLPATRMRYVAVDRNDPRRWVGGSERGLWWTDDGGQRWHSVDFEGLAGEVPQIQGLVPPAAGELDRVYVASDDGLWVTSGGGTRATPVALRGEFITDITRGSTPTELVGVVDHDRVFRIEPAAPGQITWLTWSRVAVGGLPEHVSLYRFFFDLHFGYGLFNRTLSTLINDYGGVAFMVLAVSGFLFWWFPRRWRRARPPVSIARKRSVFNWLYRAHAPVVGILALIPVGYLALTAIPMVHIGGFGTWADDVLLPRGLLPPVYQFRSLRGEVDQIMAYPEDRQRFSIGTRFGVLHSADGGESWQRDQELPVGRGNFYRVGSAAFFSTNGGDHLVRPGDDSPWQALDGIATATTDGVQHGEQWILKNSRGFNLGSFVDGFALTDRIVMPDLPGGTLYLFLIDIHVGLVFHRQFRWVNDAVSVLALLLVITGPVIWWRAKWR